MAINRIGNMNSAKNILIGHIAFGFLLSCSSQRSVHQITQFAQEKYLYNEPRDLLDSGGKVSAARSIWLYVENGGNTIGLDSALERNVRQYLNQYPLGYEEEIFIHFVWDKANMVPDSMSTEEARTRFALCCSLGSAVGNEVEGIALILHPNRGFGHTLLYRKIVPGIVE